MQNPIKIARQHISAYQLERRRSQLLDRKMEEALIDPGLIDRILEDRSGGPAVEPVEEPKPRALLSMDGILRTA